MDYEFDKEIDSLLREAARTADGPAAGAGASEHVDADEISLFAENELPAAARSRVTGHLADCGRCRTILSNVIALNAEAVTEEPAAVPLAVETAGPADAAPWYRNLFTSGHLAYGLGALVLVFAVGIGFLLVRNLTTQQSGELAQAPATDSIAANDARAAADEAQEAPAEADSDGAGMSAANANVGTDAPDADTVASSNTATEPAEEGVADGRTSSTEMRQNTTGEERSAPAPVASSPARRDLKKRGAPPEDSLADDAEAEEMNNVAVTEEAEKADKVSANRTQKEEAPAETGLAAGRTVQQPKKKGTKNEPTAEKKREDDKDEAGRRTVAGKTFERRGDTWYDTAYRNEPTTDVRRGTDRYRRLDRGLRTIGDRLEGTVVVVWQRKAYKIQ